MARRLPKIRKLEDAIAQVTDWEAYHERLAIVAAETRDSENEVEHHKRRLECRAMRGFLEGLLRKQRGIGFELLPEDLEGLPPELMSELGISDSDQQELDILKLMEDEGGTISLDLLLVRWYQAKRQIMKRRALTSRLYRMQQKGRIFALAGTKGVYTLHNPEEIRASDAAKIDDAEEQEEEQI